ncbi:MAG: prepilin-type N-terminal cleavage/methylation domain-containing protein [Candidatus Omnitrophica bacterium]|nr:prepilin-type N-terminal cleavage/methylation domain-containing protein [Candidatus Omnitrophota bacterium]
MKKSFTLIELIVVIAIIAILAAIIAPNAFRAIEKAKVTRAIADIKATKTAILSHYADTAQWPLEEFPDDDPADGFVDETEWVPVYSSTLVNATSGATIRGWDGPYLDGSMVMHPWGGIYALYCYDLEADGAPYELSILISNHCFPTPGVFCAPKAEPLQKIDDTLDNGILTNGTFRIHPVVGNDEAFYIYHTGA